MKRTVVLAAIALAAISLCVDAGQAPQVTEARSASAVVMRADGDIAGGRLVVTGPDGYVETRSFAKGETFRIPATDLADGAYNFELQFSTATRRARGQAFEGVESIPAYSGTFRVLDGAVFTGSEPEDTDAREASAATNNDTVAKSTATDTDGGTRAQVFTQDVIVQGSQCVGVDCVTSESFGFDTIRLKENNLRIKFQDTSTSASFPSNDWQLTANDSSNGGANRFSIDDVDSGRTPFTIEASAPSHSLFVDDAGRIGMGTSTPVVQAHQVDGNTPTLRLEQNGSSGFTPQTWDIAGNEANFFVRDVTNGSKLPFRIKPGAPDDSIFIAANGDIGMGTDSPEIPLHVVDNAVNDVAKFESDEDSTRVLIENNFSTSTTWGFSIVSASDDFRISKLGTGGPEFSIGADGTVKIGPGSQTVFRLTPAGDILISGAVTENTTPDYVFSEDYDLLTLNELERFIVRNRHLPNIPSAEEVTANGLSIPQMQLRLLEKIEELTLYIIDQEKRLASQDEIISGLQEEVDSLQMALRVE
jgi:hypothetical protein